MNNRRIRRTQRTRLTSALVPFLAIADVGAAQAAKSPGSLAGSIGGDAIDITGTCSFGEGGFEFWSDGTDFAVPNDSNGDGTYRNISVTEMGTKTYNALWYSRGGDRRYKGLFSVEDRGERSMSVDTELGRDDIPAKFEVRCEA